MVKNVISREIERERRKGQAYKAKRQTQPELGRAYMLAYI